jgi:hypothetical protein
VLMLTDHCLQWSKIGEIGACRISRQYYASHPESDHFIRAELDRECDFGALVMFYLENCREKCVVAEDATK